MKAVIPAAGLGTRFLPATKAQPKEMLPVLAKPTIQYVVEEALAAGVDEVIIVSNSQKQSITAHFSPNEALVAHLETTGKKACAEEVRHAGSLPVSFVEQVEPLGLGHAVHCAAAHVLAEAADGQAGARVTPAAVSAASAAASPSTSVVVQAQAAEAFYVLLGDVLVPDGALLPRMLAVSCAHGDASVIAVFRVPRDQVSRFGIVAGKSVGDSVWRVTGMVEKPPVEHAPSDLAIFGRYLLSPRVMRLLAHIEPGAGGEIQLTDALIELLEYEEVYALIINPDEGFDVGTIESWLATNLRLAQRDPTLAPAASLFAGMPTQNEEECRIL
jgi:UTP--glucose-1-phosphate uridylyltransferase